MHKMSRNWCFLHKIEQVITKSLMFVLFMIFIPNFVANECSRFSTAFIPVRCKKHNATLLNPKSPAVASLLLSESYR